MLGDRLKLARAAAGLSLRALEQRLDGLVTAQAIGKYERDEMFPSSPVLMALADALGVPESYLLSSGNIELQDVEFRKLKGASAKEKASVAAQVLKHAERYLEVEDALAAASTDWTLPPDFPRPIRSLDQAESAAEALRAVWQLGSDPIPSLAEFLEEKGIKVLAIGLAESISGMTAKIQRSAGRFVPMIVINTNHAGERQRFTLAHELGHLLLRPLEGVDIERACDRFAGALLVPARMLYAEVGQKRQAVSPGELLKLKRLFLASVQCIVYRLKDLAIITPTLYAQLFAIFGRLGWRKKEPDPLPPEETQRFQRLCFRALAERVLSESKTAELLDVTVRRLNQMLDAGATA